MKKSGVISNSSALRIESKSMAFHFIHVDDVRKYNIYSGCLLRESLSFQSKLCFVQQVSVRLSHPSVS